MSFRVCKSGLVYEFKLVLHPGEVLSIDGPVRRLFRYECPAGDGRRVVRLRVEIWEVEEG